jgi:hypothetical protein
MVKNHLIYIFNTIVQCKQDHTPTEMPEVMQCSFCGVSAVDGASFDGNNGGDSCGPNEERTSQSHAENWMMVCDMEESRGNHPCPHGWYVRQDHGHVLFV